MTEDKIINRIQKMLALANDLAATEGERDNALRMAYNLMAKHNLDLARVEAFGKKVEEARIRFQNTGWSWMWAKQTRMIVADLFFCKYYYGGSINGTQCRHNYVGRESNAMTAAVMADFVVDSILKEGRKIYKQNTAPGTRAFAIGAMHRLSERVEAIKAAQSASMEQESSGTALVLASHFESEKAANELFISEEMGISLEVKRGGNRTIKDAGAYYKGREYGDKINLSEQLSEKKGSKQLT
jgi:hypothetical protein